MAFPISPTNGQIYKNSKWNATKGAWETIVSDSTNTASTDVRRDASGNFSASTITATLSGSASSAPASDVYAWAKASTKPSYNASEVGLGSVNNTADSAKSVNYANSAGSAPANGGNATTVGGLGLGNMCYHAGGSAGVAHGQTVGLFAPVEGESYIVTLNTGNGSSPHALCHVSKMSGVIMLAILQASSGGAFTFSISSGMLCCYQALGGPIGVTWGYARLYP